jgi:MoaA/NifB/PqqE/SkfB family radical SAM enzyme
MEKNKMEKNKMEKYDYASVLFSGKCNARCSTCIGNHPEYLGTPQNLHSQQLRGLEEFLEKVSSENIRYISLSGVNADPQEYQFEMELIDKLRREAPQATLSLHTNGRLALQKSKEFNLYDRATLSFPSFNSETYRKVMGVKSLDLSEILKRSRIPIKLSMLLTEYNQGEIEDYAKDAKKLGINRIAVRKLVGREDEFKILEGVQPIKIIFENPVYQINGVEVTVWDYTRSNVRGLYLFPDGSLRDSFRK